MTLAEINLQLENLKHTKKSLERAREKFEDKKDHLQENYLNFYTLTTAIECVKHEIERLEAKDWN